MSRNSHPLQVGTAPVYGKHNLSHRHLTTLDVGRIQVMTLQECVTNDQISLNLKQVITTAPNTSPLQGKFKAHTAAFFVRNRVVMKDWTKYRTGMSNVNIPHFDLHSIVDLVSHSDDNNSKAHVSSFGLNLNANYQTRDTSSGNYRGMQASLIPFRVYRRVWWDWFRNSMVVPDTQESAYLFTDNNNEDARQYIVPHYANWDKDFMSNFLRTPNGDSRTTAVSSNASTTFEGRGSLVNMTTSPSSAYVSPINANMKGSQNHTASSVIDGNILSPVSTTMAASGSTIDSLRNALGLQAVIEKMNALGGRLKDRLKGMFGSSVSYEVLGMSELLGYNEYDVNFDNETSPVGTATPQSDINAFGTTDPFSGSVKGQLGGKSTMTENGLSNVNYHVTEDGYLMVVTWLTPDVMLSRGLDAHWFRGIDGIAPSRFDFLTDEFVGKGFDPVSIYEVATIPDGITSIGTFDPFTAVGFNAKYHNYTYHHDIISGDFANREVKNSMRNWYLDRDILKEQEVVDNNGDLREGKTITDVASAINFDNLQGLNAATRVAYDANFMYTGADIDHFVCQNKCELIITRRLPSAPRVDMLTQNPVNTGIGGTRL